MKPRPKIILPGDDAPPTASILRATPSPAPPPDLSRFAVLVPFMDAILHPVEDALRALERMGVMVVRRAGCSAIDYCRSDMASQALAEGREAILFVDSDVLFNPKDAVRLLLRPEPIVAGLYSQKRYGKINCQVDLDAIPELKFGDIGQDYEVEGVGAGFLRIRSEALIAIAEFHQLPMCTAAGSGVIPFFLPMVVFDERTQQYVYTCEDYSFCLRARQAGLKVIADTRIRLHHLGLAPFGWEHAAGHRIKWVSGIAIPTVRPEESQA